MNVKRNQVFVSKTGQTVKVTKVNQVSAKPLEGFCTIANLVEGKAATKTSRTILLDSLRRRYTQVIA